MSRAFLVFSKILRFVSAMSPHAVPHNPRYLTDDVDASVVIGCP